VLNLFAQDLSDAERAVLLATQGPINGAALGGAISQAARKTRATSYLIGDEDKAILKLEQERTATRMNATIAHVGSSHVPMLSHPDIVARFILQAAA